MNDEDYKLRGDAHSKSDTQDKVKEILDTITLETHFQVNQLPKFVMNTSEAKAAIEKLILEARIDQMEYVNQRMIDKKPSGDRVFYDKDDVIAEDRLLDQQRIIFNAMKAELKAKLGDKE